MMGKQKRIGILLAILILLSTATFLRVFNLDACELQLNEINFLTLASPEDFAHLAMSKAELPFGVSYVDMPALPFSYILSSVWIQYFGSREVGARLLSAIIGVVSILMFSVFLQTIFNNKKTVFIGAILFAFNPGLIVISRSARMYSLFIFSALFSFTYFVNVFLKNRKGLSILYLVATFAMVSSHYIGVLLLLSQGGILLVLNWRQVWRFVKHMFWLGVGFVPWIIGVIIPKLKGFYIVKLALNWLPRLTLVNLLSIGEGFFSFKSFSMGAPILFALGVALLNWTALIVLVIPVAMFFLGCFIFQQLPFGFSLANQDYFIVLIPFMLGVLSNLLCRLKRVGWFLLIIFVGVGLIGVGRIYQESKPYTGAVERILAQDPGAIILFYPSYYNIYLYHYYQEVYESQTLHSYFWDQTQIREFIDMNEEVWLIFRVSSKPNMQKEFSKLFQTQGKSVDVLEIDSSSTLLRIRDS